MYNFFVSAKAMLYEKIQRLSLGYTYTIGSWGIDTQTHNCYNITLYKGLLTAAILH